MTSLDGLRALEQAASPGPWRAHDDHWIFDAADEVVFAGSMLVPDDAEFVVAARNALPGLLGRVEAAEAERDALRKKLESVVGLFEQAISELPVEESAYQGDDFFAIPRAIDLVLTLRYELPGLRAVLVASVPSGPSICSAHPERVIGCPLCFSVPSGPAAGPTTSKETR